MSDADSRKTPRPWIRKAAPASGPDRRAGGFYRTAERKGTALGGVPLTSAEDAVVAAVRMGYKVAEAQVERSTRLARRLRDAGERAVGPGSERQAVDAAERLVFRTMMGGLTWLEGAAAERDSPLKRILDAQYRMVGSMLGLTPADSATPATPSGEASSKQPRRDEPRPSDPPRRHPARFLNVRHTSEPHRMVRVVEADIAAVTDARTKVVFYNAARPDLAALKGELILRGRNDTTLEISTNLEAPAGAWRAAICDTKGLQLGFMEIVL